jgi:hypothetical protein
VTDCQVGCTTGGGQVDILSVAITGTDASGGMETAFTPDGGTIDYDRGLCRGDRSKRRIRRIRRITGGMQEIITASLCILFSKHATP